ncbi:5'-nucleotidase C-terminal domain-containing protein (plasmid) [Azospirillum oryzae]|uniref:5'-nucleotidase C-terminal domain-containing protein n=1 Tax=Azospirillum oryzae TaxID=286727 RepID=A0A6N1ARH3_9PROT|nr:5'-nucleotidase C-terminal domain-containing protein [Azospirillum oryzae]KAA0584891.1 bifunctional metallophosphatase/5'-nucleotidase [Azospirillum oryzae]QKS54371.1 5'-nucleotidase C-terminal domain-containing protein [Azospirillum oryzae]GLR78954.1 multifunctional 2',3'-cyclic-nucleotide 2'-phosphodiesterase/5'-nucleotidase/3'-nucleotidase [Azospirillum oryzae]
MLFPFRLIAAPLFAVILGAALPSWAQNGTLTFLHVNDVYEIAPVKGQGGFGPLMTLLKRERAAAPDAITTVGGDFLSPSLLSGTTRGEQMIALFNAIGVDAVTFGNHEFDFGPDTLKQRMAESKFSWIGSNVRSADGSAFAGTVPSWTRTIDGITVGFIGLITPDTARLSSAGPSLSFSPVLETAAAAVKELRAKGAAVVVALTHLTIAEDRELAAKVKGIDLILGGHDHDPISFYEGSTLILKAGHDAQYLGVVKLAVETKESGKGPATTTVPTEWRFVTTAGVAPDPAVETVVEGYTKRLDSDLAAVIGTTATELDSRKDVVRSREASMGNLIADALRDALKADVAITNGGGIRADALHPAGSTLTRKDIFAELPFGNVGVLVEMSGQDLISTLEHGVGKVEEKAGRFPQVSGLTMTYDPKAPAGRRVTSVMVGGKPLDPQATYRVATNDYMLKGGDGYAAFPRAKVIVDASGAVLLATIVMNYVEAKKTVAPAVDGRIVAK